MFARGSRRLIALVQDELKEELHRVKEMEKEARRTLDTTSALSDQRQGAYDRLMADYNGVLEHRNRLQEEAADQKQKIRSLETLEKQQVHVSRRHESSANLIAGRSHSHAYILKRRFGRGWGVGRGVAMTSVKQR